jgi:type VI secretion system protein ImpC
VTILEKEFHYETQPLSIAWIDHALADIQDYLSDQLDVILHHPDFQALEASWRALETLCQTLDATQNAQIWLWSVSKEALKQDFTDNPWQQSHLYRHTYTQEFDMPGGEPYAAMITQFGFEPTEMPFLHNMAQVAAISHCPLISNVDSTFFQKKSFVDVVTNPHFDAIFDKADYIYWKNFRQSEEARYVGLCLPRIIQRTPYGVQRACKALPYTEATYSHSDYLWGYASFAFAHNLLKSFQQDGWAVNIRGPESGGRVDKLPLPTFLAHQGVEMKIPTEVVISESQEITLSREGFIPLSYYKNRPYACFFSAHSTKIPSEYQEEGATANSRLNIRLPYVFLASRLGHYLKVMQRENIGSRQDALEIERRLNQWLKSLMTKMPDPTSEQMAHYPLKEGKIQVHPVPDNPGYYTVSLHAVPHFQIEGMDVQLYLVSQLSKKE